MSQISPSPITSNRRRLLGLNWLSRGVRLNALRLALHIVRDLLEFLIKFLTGFAKLVHSLT